MHQVTCKDCGKRYDYDVDDFCPKCGSYNPPAKAKGTQIEQEMLSRFGDGREKQNQKPSVPQRSTPGQTPLASASKTSVQPPAGYSTPRVPQPKYTPHSAGTAAARTVRPKERIAYSKKEQKKASPVTLIVVVFLLVMAVNVLPLAWQVVEPVVQGITAPKEEYLSVPQEILFHTVGESFDLNDVNITITETWWQDLSALSTFQQDGMNCLAVSVYITGGTRRDDLRIQPPTLELESGVQISLDHSSDFAYALKKKVGAYNVTLSDYQWEDPLYGQFFFFVPEGEETATLVLEEYPVGDPEALNAKAVHYIALTLP